MKRYLIIFLLTVACCWASCTKDEEAFAVNLPADAFTFTPIMGGAVMHYKLPDDPEIVGIKVRYNDVYGNSILRSGSSLTDELTLPGFNEAQKGISAQVTLCKVDKTESQPISVTFDTKDSAPIQFINSIDVESSWDGFSMNYTNPEGATGMAHVFYLGTNPQNNEPDTVLVGSFSLSEGKDEQLYKLQQQRDVNTVVVRVEDYRGYIVKERVWKDIKSLNTARLDATQFEIVYTNSLEFPEDRVGLQYLTDGDTKGTSWFKDSNKYHYYTFLSKQNGAGENCIPMYIDLKRLRLTSELRFYTYLYIGRNKPSWDYYGEGESSPYWNDYYNNKVPCSITVYGCKEDNDSRDWDKKEWIKIGSFEQAPDLPFPSRWSYHCPDGGGETGYTFDSLDKMEAASPIYTSVSIKATGQEKGYRYLKIIYNDTFRGESEAPTVSNSRTQHITLQELEVYSAKE